MRLLLATFAVILLAGCAIPPYEIRAPFNHDDFAWSQASGTGVIEGQAFMRQRGGGIVTAAGSEVLALPANDYTNEMARALQLGLVRGGWANLRPAVANYARSTVAGVDGDFRFDGLPAGEWIVVTDVNWVVADVPQGGTLAQRVAIEDGEVRRIILSR